MIHVRFRFRQFLQPKGDQEWVGEVADVAIGVPVPQVGDWVRFRYPDGRKWVNQVERRSLVYDGEHRRFGFVEVTLNPGYHEPPPPFIKAEEVPA